MDQPETSGLIVCDTPEKINAFRLLALRGALKLETKGLKGRFNAFVLVKKEFGLKGSKIKVLAEFEKILKDKGILS